MAYLVVDKRWRVGAQGVVGVKCRISFNVHVECQATRSLVAERSASESIESIQSMQTHVCGGSNGALQISENS
jgi:hypothetical protein